MQEIKVKLGDNGGIFMPAEYQEILDLKPGDEVVIKLDDGEVRIVPAKNLVRRAQELVRRYIPADRKIVDELIQDRRKEAAHE